MKNTNIHYYQQKYQKSDFIYQERTQPHPDTSSRTEESSESPSVKKLEELKKYLKNTPEIITGDSENSQREKAITDLSEQLTLTLSRDPLYLELKTLLDFILETEGVHKFIWGIRHKREEAERVIREPGYSSLPHLFTVDHGTAKLYGRLTEVLNSMPQKAVSLDPIITKYLHPEAVSYIRNNIFNEGLKIALQRDREKTIAITEKAEAILKTRRETPEQKIESLKKQLRENPNIFQQGDTTLIDFKSALDALPDDQKNKPENELLFKLIKTLIMLQDELISLKMGTNYNLSIPSSVVDSIKKGYRFNPNEIKSFQEIIKYTEDLFGEKSETRQLILESQALLHPSVVQFIKEAPPLQELYKVKREIDKYLQQN